MRNLEGLLRKLISVLFLFVCLCAANFADADMTEVLKQGSENEQVKLIQEILVSEGFYRGEVDGIFGKATKLSVMSYQKKHQLLADGIVGQETLGHLFDITEHDHNDSDIIEASSDVEQKNVISRGMDRSGVAPGAYLDWWKDIRNKLVFPDDEIIIKDFKTGREFRVLAIAGTNHMDVEALTLEDAQIIQGLWDGYSWERRPVIAYLDGQAVAGSLNGMPHAGRDDKPYTDYVYNRSGGFGYGYNYDKVKGNDFEGVICLHFKNSLLHKNAVKDRKHQAAVRTAAGLE